MFSVLITIYNAAQFVEETIHSVFAQSYDKWELVIVDDGSTDNSIDLIKQIKRKNSDRRIDIYQPGKLGRGAALNYGISKANFDWIAILDADDLWHPQKLEIQSKFLLKFDIVGTKAKIFNNQCPEIELISDKQITLNEVSLHKLIIVNSVTHCSIVVKKNILKYNQNLKSQLDWDMLLDTLSNGGNLAKISLPLTFHRIHDEQSFEKKMGITYKINSVKIQWKYMIKNSLYYLFPLIIVRLIFLLTPRTIRLLFRRSTN